MSYENEKAKIIFWATQLYKRGLVFGKSGNISLKVEKEKILITTHDTYLGLLEKEDILLLDINGKIIEGEKSPTSEKEMHLKIHQEFSEKKVIIHAHPPHTVYFFHFFKGLEPISFEERFYLGRVVAIPQYTPTVTELGPVIKALENSDIVVLKNHGVVAIGEDFKSAFSLIELLEAQARLNLLTYSIVPKVDSSKEEISKRYKLFSQEHMACLVDLINGDEMVQSLGKRFNLTTVIGIKETDRKVTYFFHYEQGKITKFSKDEGDAEFLISAKTDVWKKIFNREIDPFVASTQGKIKIRGDFNRLSQWFPVFERTFKLWAKVPVE